MNKELQNLLFILQLEEYDTKRFLAWIKTHDTSQIKQEKKHLVWTLKAKVVFFLAYPLSVLGVKPLNSLIWVTQILLLPENLLRFSIIFLGRIKLLFFPKLIVIGITGSYGKTSVKEIAYHLLKTQYDVLKTPESYNTPLGIAKIILTRLNREYQIFIVEMGAYHIGDIKKMCAVVHPQIGILTAIGKQHLERFGSQENIISAKAELLASLPKNGVAVVNGDNLYCRQEAKNLSLKTILYQIGPIRLIRPIKPNLSIISASSTQTAPDGSLFQIKHDREVTRFQTQLLGTHNITNILAGIAVARELNISWEKIKTAVSTLLPIPHRLQLISRAHNTTVIDDAYNANPDSAKAALEVLKSFASPRKIVVTPGLIELGPEQKKENELMGKEISEVADYLLIVGNTNKEVLKKGFLFSRSTRHLGGVIAITPREKIENRVFFCRDLKDVTIKLQEIIIPNSVILFENDLPDQYL